MTTPTFDFLAQSSSDGFEGDVVVCGSDAPRGDHNIERLGHAPNLIKRETHTHNYDIL